MTKTVVIERTGFTEDYMLRYLNSFRSEKFVLGEFCELLGHIASIQSRNGRTVLDFNSCDDGGLVTLTDSSEWYNQVKKFRETVGYETDRCFDGSILFKVAPRNNIVFRLFPETGKLYLTFNVD